jgi:hypothetical protein
MARRFLIGRHVFQRPRARDQNHQVRADSFHPLISRLRFRGIRIGITDRPVTLEHVGNADLCLGRILLAFQSIQKLTHGSFMHIESVPSVPGLSGKQVHPLLPLRITCPSRFMIVACFDNDDGAARSAPVDSAA